jgi:MFS family permease
MILRSVRLPFRSLSVPNYRRYFTGQVISISGNWMQTVGEMWLVLRLTGSSAAVGLTAAAQFAPMLFAGAWGGLLADRLPKRRLLTITQTSMAIPALTLWGLTASGSARPWMVFALVFARGAINAVDNPARQSFVMELVGRDRVVNAVSLNSLIVQSARMIGPGLAGLVIATVGIAPCFLINALSFGAMIVALRMIEVGDLHGGTRVRRERGQLREAFRYVAATPQLRVPLVAMAVVGTLSFNFQVILPLMARFAFHGTATTYAALTTAMALGAMVGALAAGARQRVSTALLSAAGVAFGLFSLAAAAAPTLGLEFALLAATGAASVTFAAGTNSTLQLGAAPAMRGRVMSLYSVVFLGSTPIGAPIAGWLAGSAGPRSAMVLAGVAAVAGGLGLRLALARERASRLLETEHVDRLLTGVNPELPEDALDVGSDRLDGEPQLVGNGVGGQSVGEEAEDLSFASGQRGAGRLRPRRRFGLGARTHRAELGDQSTGHDSVEGSLPPLDSVHHSQQGVDVDVLLEEPDRSRAKREQTGFLVKRRGQDHNANVGRMLGDPCRSGDAVASGHGEVDDSHVGP